MHILLVDDEAELADPLKRILNNQGYEVDVAHSGDRGLVLAQSKEYNLLILDWLMPGLSGLEICRQLRQTGDRTPQTNRIDFLSPALHDMIWL
jgi:two-component system, OmpR family, manganese sensing response regulator